VVCIPTDSILVRWTAIRSRVNTWLIGWKRKTIRDLHMGSHIYIYIPTKTIFKSISKHWTRRVSIYIAYYNNIRIIVSWRYNTLYGPVSSTHSDLQYTKWPAAADVSMYNKRGGILAVLQHIYVRILIYYCRYPAN